MSPVRIRYLPAAFAVFLLLTAGGAAAQQHSYAPADIESGEALYRANCLGCHGDEGDAVEGADLSNGRFRYGSSDEDLIRIIRNGIPDTPMAPQQHLSVGEARTVVAFLRSFSTGRTLSEQEETDVLIGNAAAGETLFHGRAECGTCHGVNGGGNRLSPDLGEIGARRSPVSLERAIFQPDAEVRPEHRFYRVVEADGTEVIGKLLNQDTHSVQLMNEDEELVSYMKAGLAEYGFVGSRMPTYRDVLSDEQAADLVAYMLTLRGESAQ